jgi:hypothetical protein
MNAGITNCGWKKPVCALSTSVETIRRPDPAANEALRGSIFRYLISRQAWFGLKRYADSSAAVISNSIAGLILRSFFLQYHDQTFCTIWRHLC